ncbi:MAG: hypothetical protein ACLF0G_07290 [Candidatus Brocadiia bacterium]
MNGPKEPSPAPLAPWERWAPLVLLLVAAGGVAVVLLGRPPLGVPGQHEYPYHPCPRWAGVVRLLVLAVPLAVLWGVGLVWGPALERRQELVLALGLAAASVLLHVGSATASKEYPGAELSWPFLWQNTEGSYAHYVPPARSAARFVSNYPHALDVSPQEGTPHYVRVHHPQVHPPGPVLLFAGLEGLYDAAPWLERAVGAYLARALPSTAVLRQGEMGFALRHPVVVSATVAFGTVLVAGLAPLACYLALRPVWPGRAALGAAGLTALVPGTHLFNPSFDQAYPTLALLLCAAGTRAVSTRRTAWGVAFGLGLYVLMFFHVGFALVVVVLGAGAALAWRASGEGWRPGEAWRAYRGPAVGAVLGFLSLAFLLQVSLGYPTFRVIGLCLRNNRLFNEMVHRTYWPWVAVAPFEFALSLGFGLFAAAAVGWLGQVGGMVRGGWARCRAPLLVAAGGAMLALHVLGMNRGETARLWLLLTPLLVAGTTRSVRGQARAPRRILLALGAAQLLQVVLFRVGLDPGRTTDFFVTYLPTQ